MTKPHAACSLQIALAVAAGIPFPGAPVVSAAAFADAAPEPAVAELVPAALEVEVRQA